MSAAAERAREAANKLQVRADLARELHDGIVQTLTGMLMDIEAYKAEQSGRSGAIDQLASLQRNTRNVLDTLREVLTDLRGTPRFDGDFVVGVRRLASEVAHAHGIEVKVIEADWPHELRANLAMHLYRIAQHALQNMVLHSGAGHVVVSLDGTTRKDLIMMIEDDGLGAPVDNGSGRGLGLIGMRERAVLINGDLTVGAAPEGGTQVIVTVPRGTGILCDVEERYRVLIADDQTLFRHGLATLLAKDPRIEVVGECGDGTDALREVERLRPDIVLLDLKMPGMDGGEAAVRIHAEFPSVRIVMLSTFGADADVVQAMRAGARGYMLKDTETEALIYGLLSIMRGEIVMDEPIACRMVDMAVGHESPTRYFYDGLTQRELQILKLVATGLANKEVAYRLGIRTKTVSNHMSNVYTKLNIADRSQAALYAVRKGLIDA